MNNENQPQRGDIYWTVFEPSIGTEVNGKKRLALVISNDWYNEEYKRVAILPISSKTHHVYPFELYVGKLIDDQESKIMCDQIKSFDKWRLKSLVGKLPKNLLKEVETKLKRFLLLPNKTD